MSDRTRAASRYADLVQQLGDERAHAYGWRSAVARQLRVDPSYVTRVAKGERTGASQGAIARAVAALGISESFFSAEAGHYRDFMATDVERADRAHTDREFDVMRALVALDDETRSRVLAWANARWSR